MGGGTYDNETAPPYDDDDGIVVSEIEDDGWSTKAKAGVIAVVLILFVGCIGGIYFVTNRHIKSTGALSNTKGHQKFHNENEQPEDLEEEGVGSVYANPAYAGNAAHDPGSSDI